MNAPSEEELLAHLGEIPDPGGIGVRPPTQSPARSVGPARRVVRGRRALALAASVVWIGANLVVFRLRGDFPALPLAYLQADIALPYALAAGCLALALAPGRLGLGANVRLLALLAVLGPALFWLLAAGAPLLDASGTTSNSLAAALKCLGLTLLWTTVPLCLAALTLRGAFPAASGWRGALVGAAAGLCAGATINLHCPNVASFHVLTGHGLPLLLATFFGALVVARSARG
jgi:hypothetical protein